METLPMVDIVSHRDGSGQRSYPLGSHNEWRRDGVVWSFFPANYFMACAVIRNGEVGFYTDNVNAQLYLGGEVHLGGNQGERELEIGYSPDGQLKTLDYRLHVPVENSDFPREVGIQNGKVTSVHALNPDEFQITPESKVTLVRRVEGGKVFDEIVVPNSIDIESLKQKFFPRLLLMNPTTEETLFDTFWKNEDPVHEANIRWDALENDQYDSLPKRIPKPAPDEK